MKSVFLDLFSGIGGFAKGLEESGFQFRKHYFSDTDKYAVANYLHNYRKAEYVGAIEKIKEKTFKNYPDIITFGFPCQDISIAGEGKGLKGSRSGLFYQAIRLIKAFRPSVFIFENVKALFSNDKGRTFEIVLQEIAKIGLYDCEWQLINSRWFLPQNRERIYFIGHLRGRSRPKVFPFQENDFKTNTNEARQVAATITATKGLRNTDNYVTDSAYKNVRTLTPLECERLQGFPDGWTRYGYIDKQHIEISDRQRYILIGNSVSVPVVKAIGKRLISQTLRKPIVSSQALTARACKIQRKLKEDQ